MIDKNVFGKNMLEQVLKSLDIFGEIWTSLTKFDQVIKLIKFKQIFIHLDSIWSILIKFEQS